MKIRELINEDLAQHSWYAIKRDKAKAASKKAEEMAKTPRKDYYNKLAAKAHKDAMDCPGLTKKIKEYHAMKIASYESKEKS